jgi:archaemetzincin
MLQRVGHLRLGEDLLRKAREFGFIECVTRHFGDVDSDPDDHDARLLASRRAGGLARKAPELTPPWSGETCLAVAEGDWSGRLFAAEAVLEKISLVPINGVGVSFCERLAPCLEERFFHKFAVEKPLTLSPTHANLTRGQFFLNTVFNRMLNAYPAREGFLLGILASDLYKTSHPFIFGDASDADRVAVVSTFRLNPEFSKEPPNDDIFFQRTLKECVHALGHAFALKHCHNARCAMYLSHSVFDIDAKQTYFCDLCDKRVRANR